VTAETALLFFRVPKRTSLELPACWEHDQARAISSMEIHVFKKATERLEPPSADPSPIEC